jgi:hypothetical protein
MKIKNYLIAVLQYIYQNRLIVFNDINYTVLDEDIHHVVLANSYKPQHSIKLFTFNVAFLLVALN